MIESIKFDNVVWSHIIRPTEEDLQALKDYYHFHPLDLEDCRSPFNLRPKIDVYDDYYFLILHFPTFDATGTFLDIREIKIFWGKDYLITIGRSHWIVKEIFTQEKKDSEAGKKLPVNSSDALLYRILEYLMGDTSVLVEKINKNVEACGKLLFSRHAEKTIEKFSVTRKNVILLNTMFKPQLALFNKLQIGAVKGFAENMEEYWGNILDAYQRVWDIVEDAGELIKGYSMTFDSLQVNKTNEVIKILTLVSSILLPLTFIASMYGMNIDLPIQHNPRSFIILCAVMVAIAIGMVIYFKIRKWM
ncbi:MAG TPA: magnesium transporter CorA family protein [Bacteroidales bacterium]|nr:magnesium transporter CorA family protein [Bacteroidales bacterium]